MKPICCIAATLLTAVPALASAGALTKVTHGIKQKTGADDRDGGAAADAYRAGTDSPGNRAYRDHRGCCDPVGNVEPGVVYYGAPPPASSGMSNVDVFVGLQSVVNSDGAATFQLRAHTAGFGVGFAGTSYYERVPGLSGSDYLRMDNFDLHVTARVLRVLRAGRATELWVRGGLAGVSSHDFQVFGGSLAVDGTTELGGALAVSGSARYARFQDDLTAVELTGGVHLSILRVGYRMLRFDVGPPLKGPEVGLAWRF